MKQCTIQTPTQVKGVGLHTGKTVTLTFKPAEPHFGIKFVRVDLPEHPLIAADVSKVISTNRGTTLKSGEAQVHTVEHALSALTGLEVDNVIIEIDGPEIPIMDGSSMPFVKALLEAGIQEQDAIREYFVIKEPIAYRDELSGTELIALPDNDFHITTMIDFNSQVLGQQYAALDNLQNYVQDIAPCRTFVFVHELESLLAQNLIKGGDLDNAIVIADRKMDVVELEALAQRLGKTGIKVDKEGILNTTELHFKNEPARHKLLDVIGDLTLVGKRIKGKIVATKPGHTANIEFARILKKHAIEQQKLDNFPKYDSTQEPILNTEQIREMLPHRYPFLMIDKIIEISDTHVVALKNVTINEAFFQGHFPGNPIMPGVLQIEAMAQTGGILALSLQAEKKGWDTYFLKIDNCKFKQKVVPGDTLLLKMELMSPIRRGIVQMMGTAFVGNKIVSEAELTAQIVKRTV